MQIQKRMFNPLPLAPPTGFRKAIPVLVKLTVVIRQNSKCAECGEPLGKLDGTEFDHIPALQLRCWDPDAKDTVPPANDEASIFAKHADCHAAKTFGTGGSKRGADVTEIARTKRISKSEEEFRRRILAKTDPAVELPEPPRRKSQWSSRPFEKRGKDGASSSRGKKGSSGFGR
jgi:hypothetical protein